MQLNKLRVAHLTSVHTPSDTRILYKECATLAAAGYDVVLVAPGKVERLPPGVRLHSIARPANRAERMTRTVWHVFQAAMAERADIYHFHDPELIFVGILLRLRGARVIFDVHEDIPHDVIDKPWIPALLKRPVAALATWTLQALQRRCSAVVAATPSIARRFVHNRTVVVANFPMLDELAAPTAGSFEIRLRSAVYLGSVTELRSIFEIVRAFESPAMAPGARLLLAGTFETEGLERRVRAMRGWQSVDYVGNVPRDRVCDTLARARAGILLFRPALSVEDAMPTKLFEYMAAGLPVVISSSLKWSAIVADGECGLVVDPMDCDAIARAVSFLIENPSAARSMGERGRRLVMERYEWSTEGAKLTNLYRQIA
jgi:glycosyltransferase involved in cell wall biosynthesis